MAKRIALKNNIFINKKLFWIFKKLKRKGFIAGKYEIYRGAQNNGDLSIREILSPKVIKELNSKELFFQAYYEDKKDLKEFLDLSNKNFLHSNEWQKELH